MMGSMASTFNGPARRVCPRSAHRASKSPMNVVPSAVASARPSVFQATPQRLPARQPSDQTRSVARRSSRLLQA